VRALKRDAPFLKDVYGLVAEKQHRKQDIFTKKRKTDFVYVLKRLKVVAAGSDTDAKADRMWEKLFELALFVRSDGVHRKAPDILRKFINAPDAKEEAALTKQERSRLQNAFDFLTRAYKQSTLGNTRLASEYSHFYIMITALLKSDLRNIGDGELTRKLVSLGSKMDTNEDPESDIGKYLALSSKQTTDAEKRKDRQMLFVSIVKGL